MKYEWLNKQNNKDLIVFFCGWGGGKNCISLNFQDSDVLMFYDYRTFEPINFDFSSYGKKYLIAWSMGVFVCNYYREIFKNFDEFIAVNGTQKPIDDNYGIPEKIYNLTVDNFNELSCKKFVSKMSANLSADEYCTRSIEELKAELIAIRDLKIEKLLNFNKAIISAQDRIIPAKNQLNWWQEQKVAVKEVAAPHYIFDLYKNWGDLI